MTTPRSAIAPRHTRALLYVLGVLLLLPLAVHLHALAAAGLTGTAPTTGATAFQKLCDTLKDNITWIIVTAFGVVGAALAGLLMIGSRTAPDWLGKMVGCVLLLLVGIPAFLA